MLETDSSKSLYMVSLGCPKNRVDSEIMLATLLNDGYKLVDEPDHAEVILINSCAFIGEAKQESIDSIFEHAQYKETGNCKALVVAGCLTQRYADVLQVEMPEVDYFVGTGAYHRINEIIRGERDRAVVPDPDFVHSSQTPRLNSMPGFTSYLKISEGCDNACSFCIIPTLRGGQRSRTIDDIVTEANALAERGVVELNLVAQDLTAYGHDLPGRPKLADLLRELAQVDVRWIRLHYAYPRDFSDALIDVMANEERITKYLDMPLQHASDAQLRLMRRGRDKKFIQGLLAKLRDRIPNLVMRSSFIVGFPGETEDDFKELCDFVAEQRFQHVGAFEFSKEEGTTSFDLPNQLTARVKASRRKALMKIQRAISRDYQQNYVGKTIEVLVEGPHPETPLLLQGRHAGQAPEIDGAVVINSGEAKPGDLVLVKIEQAGDYDLVGGIVGVSKPSAKSMAPRFVTPAQAMPVSRKLLIVLPTRQ
jgi:ribosomal protein S12 methylthiotransferase